MRRTGLPQLVLLVLLSPVHGNDCDPGWLLLGSSCYLIKPGQGDIGDTGGTDWAEARKICADHGGYLAEITTIEEWEEVQEAVEDVYGDQVDSACHQHQCHLYIGGILHIFSCC